MPALDPDFDYVLGDMVFQDDFGADPNVPPTPATTRLTPTSVVAETHEKVNFTFDAHDPAIAKLPAKVIDVYVPYPLAVDPLTPEYLLDDANAFPSAEADVAVSDATQPTVVAVEYTGPPIYGQRGCQPIYVYAK